MNRQPQLEPVVFVITGCLVAVIIGLIWLARWWISGGKTGDPFEDHARSKRRTSWVAPIAPLVVAFSGVCLAMTSGKNEETRIAGVAVAVLFSVFAFGLHAYYRRQAHLGPPKPEPKPEPVVTQSGCGALVFVALAGFIVAIVVAWVKRPPAPRPLVPIVGPAPLWMQILLRASQAGLVLGVLAVVFALGRLMISPPGQRPIDPKVYRRRWRLRGVFWPAILVAGGANFALSGSLDGTGNWLANPDRSTLYAFPVFVVLAALFYLYSRMVVKRGPLVVTVAPKNAEIIKPTTIGTSEEIQTSTSASGSRAGGVWLVLFFGFVIFVAYIWGFPAGNNARKAALPRGWACIATFAAGVALVGLFWTVSRWQTTDRAVTRAQRRAKEGDVDGAIGELEHEVEMRGPSVRRFVGLAGLYMQKKDFASALGWLRKGAAIEPKSHELMANMAFCLFELGAVTEADNAVAALTGSAYGDPGMLVALAKAILTNGRVDGASAALDRAAENLAITDFADKPDSRSILEAQIAAARAEVEEARLKRAIDP